MEWPPRMDLDTHWLACYVMMSRARTLEGLLVLRPGVRGELSRRPPAYLVTEIDRILALERSSAAELLAYLHGLPKHLVPEEVLAFFRAGAEAEEAKAVHDARRAQKPHPSTQPDERRADIGPTPPTQAGAQPAKRRRLWGKQAPSCGLPLNLPPGGSSLASSSQAANSPDIPVLKRQRVAEPDPVAMCTGTSIASLQKPTPPSLSVQHSTMSSPSLAVGQNTQAHGHGSDQNDNQPSSSCDPKCSGSGIRLATSWAVSATSIFPPARKLS